MIIKPTICLILIITAFNFCFSQTTSFEKWVRIDSEKSEVSANFPPGYLVDAVKRPDGQIYRVIGYHNGMMMEMRVENDIDARNRVKRISPNAEEKGAEFTLTGIYARRISSTAGDGKFSERVYVGAGSRFYYLSVKAPSIQKPELMRFLCYIRISGSLIHECSTAPNMPEETFPIKSLVTSEAVSQAYERKSGKNQINVVYEEETKFAPPADAVSGIVPAVIVERPHPDMRSVLGGGFGGPSSKKMNAKLKINFLANGQIGDITVYSSNKDYARACVEAAKKIKFIPAKDGDKNIDSVVVEDYGVVAAAFSSVMIISGPVR